MFPLGSITPMPLVILSARHRHHVPCSSRNASVSFFAFRFVRADCMSWVSVHVLSVFPRVYCLDISLDVGLSAALLNDNDVGSMVFGAPFLSPVILLFSTLYISPGLVSLVWLLLGMRSIPSSAVSLSMYRVV